MSDSAEIASMDVDEASAFPVEFFTRRNNRTTKLVNNDSGENFIKGQSQWYKFELTEPAFVSEMFIHADGYEYKDCQFSWVNERGKVEKFRSSFENGGFNIIVGGFISEFQFKPDKKYWSNNLIKRVEVYGYRSSEFDAAARQLVDIENARNNAAAAAREDEVKADEAREELSQLVDGIANSGVRLDELGAEITEKTKALESFESELIKLESRLTDRKKEISNNENRLENQAESIRENSLERKNLTETISELKSELRELENNIDLFPSELSGFARQSGSDKKLYWMLSGVPILILVVVTGLLIFNAANLTTIYDEHDNARLISIFLTRLPYVVVAGLIIGASYKLSVILINEVMRINTQYREFTKISIIATDVSAASEKDLNLDDEEIYHLKTGLKMDLLREHLRGLIPESFNYAESPRVKSILERITRKENDREEEDESLEE